MEILGKKYDTINGNVPNMGIRVVWVFAVAFESIGMKLNTLSWHPRHFGRIPESLDKVIDNANILECWS